MIKIKQTFHTIEYGRQLGKNFLETCFCLNLDLIMFYDLVDGRELSRKIMFKRKKNWTQEQRPRVGCDLKFIMK